MSALAARRHPFDDATALVVRRFRLFRSEPSPPAATPTAPPARMHPAWAAGRWTIVRERVAGQDRYRVEAGR